MTAQKQRSDQFAMLADSKRKDPPKNPKHKIKWNGQLSAKLGVPTSKQQQNI